MQSIYEITETQLRHKLTGQCLTRTTAGAERDEFEYRDEEIVQTLALEWGASARAAAPEWRDWSLLIDFNDPCRNPPFLWAVAPVGFLLG